MRKLIIGFLVTFVASVSSFAAQPLCYWDQDFSGPQTGGLMPDCTLDLNGRKLSADGKSVTFGGESVRKGIKVTLAEAADKTVGVTVLVAFSGYSKSADAHTVLGSSFGYVAAGVRLSDDLAVPQWYSDGSLERTTYNNTHFFRPDSAKTNFFAFTHCPQAGTKGIRFLAYEFADGSDEGQWVKYYDGTKLTGGTIGDITYVCVGGYANDNGNAYMKSPDSMTIRGIAVFSGELEADDLTTWQFPSMRKGGNVYLEWTDDESGAWTATKFGSVDYEGEDHHNVDFSESLSGSHDPVTVALDGVRSVLDLRSSAQTRDFTLTGGSVGAKRLLKSGIGRLTVDSPLTVSDQMALNAGTLILPTGYDVESLKALEFSLAAGATLGIRSSFVSNTNGTFALFSTGTLDLDDNSTLELVRLDGMGDLATGKALSVSGTGRICLIVDQTEENNLNNIEFNMPLSSFNGKVDCVLEGDNSHLSRVNFNSAQWSADSFPALSISSGNPSKAMFVTGRREFGLSSLEGNVQMNGSIGGPHKIALALARDCTYSGALVSGGNYPLTLTVSSAEPNKTFTYAGVESGAATLVLTNGATMVLTDTAKWTGSVAVSSNATLEIRRAAGALNSERPLTVDGTLKLACETGVAAANGSEIVFGEDAQLVVTASEGFFERRENRKVEFPIVTATTLLTLPEGFKPVFPEGAELVRVTNDDGDLVGLSIRRRDGLMLILR